MSDVGYFYMSSGKIFGQNKNDDNFERIDRLNGKKPQVKPASRALDRLPQDKQSRQKKAHQDEKTGEQFRFAQKTPVNKAESEENKKTYSYPKQLPREIIIAFSAERTHAYKTGHKQRNRRQKQNPIYAGVSLDYFHKISEAGNRLGA